MNNKRITKQIRISREIHASLKLQAIKQGTTISKLADFIIDKFLREIDPQNNKNSN
jgi:hypothetical protein